MFFFLCHDFLCLIYVCSWVRELTLLFSHLQRQRNTKKFLHNYHTLLSGLRPYSSLYVSGDRYAAVQLQNSHHVCHSLNTHFIYSLFTKHNIYISVVIIFTKRKITCLHTMQNSHKSVTLKVCNIPPLEELQKLHLCCHCSVLFPANAFNRLLTLLTLLFSSDFVLLSVLYSA